MHPHFNRTTLVVVKTYRVFFALLLTIVLPYSAIASMVDGLHCQHAATSAFVDDSAPMHHAHAAMMHHHGGAPTHHDHAAMAPAHAADATAAGDADCNCPEACDCAHHCAGSAGGAALTLTPFEMAVARRDALMTGTYDARVAEAQPSPAFRPPIAALPSAA